MYVYDGHALMTKCCTGATVQVADADMHHLMRWISVHVFSKLTPPLPPDLNIESETWADVGGANGQ